MRPHERRAFSLIEVALALGIAGICLLAIFGLLPIAQHTARNASEETAAPKILKAVAADLRNTPSTADSSRLFGINIPPNSSSQSATLFFTSDGRHMGTLNPTSRYRLTIQFFPNPTGASAATFANLRCSWPAAAAPSASAGSAEYFVALRRD